MIKHILLLSAMTIVPSAINAQQVSYSYDATGNRISRSSVVNAPQFSSGRNISKSVSSFLQQTLSVGPNPTSGLLGIRLSQWNDTDNCSLLLSNTSGQVLIQQAMTSADATLDLSTFPKGYYLLRVDLNGEKNTYKIIKN